MCRGIEGCCDQREGVCGGHSNIPHIPSSPCWAVACGCAGVCCRVQHPVCSAAVCPSGDGKLHKSKSLICPGGQGALTFHRTQSFQGFVGAVACEVRLCSYLIKHTTPRQGGLCTVSNTWGTARAGRQEGCDERTVQEGHAPAAALSQLSPLTISRGSARLGTQGLRQCGRKQGFSGQKPWEEFEEFGCWGQEKMGKL